MEELAGIPLGAWPLALVMALVVAGARWREGRRRIELNRSLHELRRPLQALALAAPAQPPAHAPAQLDLALTALADLDGAINGAPPALSVRPVSCRALVAAALERWRGSAARAGRSLELRWSAGSTTLLADPNRVAQALDNLLANAIEHGGLRIVLGASLCARGVRISVTSSPAAWRRTAGSARDPRGRPRRDPRRGHGLAHVAAIAAAHGGRLLLSRHGGGAIAALELPLAPAPLPAAVLDAATAA